MTLDYEAVRQALSGARVADSLKIALTVGTLLNFINQGDVIVSGKGPDWSKLILTYCVPFAVATYSAYRAYRAYNLSRRDRHDGGG